MASRPSTSVFTIVFMSILGVLCLVLFITTIVFASRAQRANERITTLQSEQRSVLEGASDQDRVFARSLNEGGGGELIGAIRAYRDLASYTAGNANRPPSDIVDRLTAELSDAARQALEQGDFDNATGDQADLARDLRELADATPDNAPSLDEALRTLTLALGQAIEDRAEWENTFRTTLVNAQDAIERIDSLRQTFDNLSSQQLDRVDDYASDVDAYSADVQQAKAAYQSDLQRIRSDADAVIEQRESEIDDLIDEVTQLRELLARVDRSESQVLPQDEGALVDGQVIGVDLANGRVFLDLGRGDKVPASITFEVYDPNTSIRPDARGELPRGKATIEVIRVDENTSTARILRGSRGNRIGEGDVVVNAIYDPDKTYRFVVFGDFDLNGDFIATPAETNQLRALIREWGGVIQDDITGSTDFVVLGERPILPPEPRRDDPTTVVQRYLEARTAQTRYDSLLEEASNTRIPVLNQNRLQTLTGIDYRR